MTTLSPLYHHWVTTWTPVLEFMGAAALSFSWFMSPSQAPGSLNWYLINIAIVWTPKIWCQILVMDSWILKREILVVGAPPPSLQGAVAGTSGRVGTLDLTFQFDNPLTGQARGQNSLVGYRHPQNISSQKKADWRPQGNKNRPLFPCSFSSWIVLKITRMRAQWSFWCIMPPLAW